MLRELTGLQVVGQQWIDELSGIFEGLNGLNVLGSVSNCLTYYSIGRWALRLLGGTNLPAVSPGLAPIGMGGCLISAIEGYAALEWTAIVACDMAFAEGR
jgi:hypothetical protein